MRDTIWARRLRATLLAGALFAGTAAPAARDNQADVCLLVVEETAGALAILDRDGNERSRIPLGLRPHELAVTHDGRTAYVAMFGIADYGNRDGIPGKTVAEIDLVTPGVTSTFQLPTNLSAPHGIQLRPIKDRELFTNAEVGGNVMLVFDTASKRLLRQFPLPPRTHNFIFGPEGKSVFSFAGAGGVSKFDADTGKLLAHADIGSPARGLRLLGRNEIAVAGKGEVVILDLSNLRERRRLKAPVDGQLAYLETLPNGTIIAPSLADGGVAIFQPGLSTRFLPTGKTPLVVRAGKDGTVYVANVLDEHLSLLSSDRLTARPVGKVSGPNGIAFARCPESRR